MNQLFLFLIISSLSFSAFAQRIDLEDLRSTIETSSVIVLGENHVALNVKKYLPHIVREIRRIDPSFDCLALELSQVMQSEFEDVASKESYKDFLHTYLTIIPYYSAIYSPLPEFQK